MQPENLISKELTRVKLLEYQLFKCTWCFRSVLGHYQMLLIGSQSLSEGPRSCCGGHRTEVRLRSTEIQPTYNICSRGGRRDLMTTTPTWLAKEQSTGDFAWEHGRFPVINPVQQGLTSKNNWCFPLEQVVFHTSQKGVVSGAGIVISYTLWYWYLAPLPVRLYPFIVKTKSHQGFWKLTKILLQCSYEEERK